MHRDTLVQLILSAIGVFASVFAFFFFFVAYANHEVGFWSILAGILAALGFHLHWVKGRGTLDRWHTRATLRNLNVVGFLSAVAGVTALIWYIFLTFYYHIPIEPFSESTAITAVWALICGKWGIYVMYYTNKFEIIIQEGSSRILTENNA